MESTSLVFAAHAIYFARQNLKFTRFDSARRVKELHNLRYLHGWAKLGIGGSITFYEWLKHGHYIHAEILGIPVTAENVSRFSSALLSGLGVMLATVRSYMDVGVRKFTTLLVKKSPSDTKITMLLFFLS